MRLIDADLFEKEIKAVAQGQATSLMPDMVELSVETIVETLDEMPTAYDVDKVMARLKKYSFNAPIVLEGIKPKKWNLIFREQCLAIVQQEPIEIDIEQQLGRYKKCENIAKEYADCDEFVCSKCGIHLIDWVKESIDEDYDDEIHSEYVFKYCPNCGAKIKAVE